ncbi:hypothetical protein VSDG_06701 [Cytospora chrysosperma]|uniref:Major facilitator superfamily (MFS) profile domain-containing protein n=1 Tax=Cytospora chrysosperma TaxID=252740 RepID=A0A423VND1_CYTCH|nr:hypothetical protein VSDG_06701 [Valsa sordida]
MSTMPSEPPMTASIGKEPEFKEVELETAIPTVSLESRTNQGLHHDARTGRRIITEREAWEHTAYNYTKPRKWCILLILWMIQITMNMNGSIWASTEDGLSSYYGVPIKKISFGNMTFLISYAFGCEIWAPWSEELGRKWLMQASLLLVSIFTALIPFAPSFTGVIFLRLFTGLATAGGSLTLGVVADMYKANEQQDPVAFVAWGSMLGSSMPPMIGGIMEYCLGVDSRRWCFWLISLCGVFVQLWHLVAVPETYYKKALNNCAKQRREKARQEGNETLDRHLYGPTEDIPIRKRFNAKEIGVTMWRPFKFLLTEPIVFFLSALSAVGDAIVFLFMEVFGHIYGKEFGMNKMEIGLVFIFLTVAYTAGLAILCLFNRRNSNQRAAHPNSEDAQYEGRLSSLCWTAWCLPCGLAIFAATANPSYGHFAWIGTGIGVFFIGIANYNIYASTIDYMVAAYGFYAASATGGNGFARNFLAGVLTPAGRVWIENMGPQAMCGILAGFSLFFFLLCILVRFKGPQLRRRSKYTVREANESGLVNSLSIHDN